MSTPSKHNAIISTIIKFYQLVHGRKPDTAEYKSEYKILEAIMYPKEDWLLGYTGEQILSTIEWLLKSGIVVKTMRILYFDHVLSSYVNEDYVMQKYIVNKLITIQQKNGLADSMYDVDKPSGW